MTQRTYRHRVEKTRNKHSRAVVRDDTIVIRLARNLSKTEEKEHIESLLERMKKILTIEAQKICVDPFRPLLEGNQQLTVTIATGKQYVFKLKPGSKLRAYRRGNIWTVTVSPKARRRPLHGLLWTLLANPERRRIVKLVAAINDEVLRVPIRSLRFAFTSSQWGSCSPRGNVSINTALLFVPPSILKYVITHELAHRKRGDHSETYWKIVEEAMPGYRRAREELLEYRLPTL